MKLKVKLKTEAIPKYKPDIYVYNRRKIKYPDFNRGSDKAIYPFTAVLVCFALWLFISWIRNTFMDKQQQLKYGNITKTYDKWILEMDLGFLATIKVRVTNNHVLITGLYLDNGLMTTLSLQYKIPSDYSTIATNSFFGKLKVVAKYERDWLFKWLWKGHAVWSIQNKKFSCFFNRIMKKH